MKLLDRYLLREYLLPLFYCIALFSMMHVIIDLLDHLPDFLEARTPARVILLYYVATLTPLLEYILPASLLMATLYALWRLTRNSELTAMRACGLSIYRIMTPYLTIGFLAGIAVLIVKETAAADLMLWSEAMKDGDFRALSESTYTRQLFYRNAAGMRTWEIDRFDLRRPDRLAGVLVKQERPDGTRGTDISADRCDRLDGEWWFFDGHIREYTPDGMGVTNTIPISPLGICMPELGEDPAQLVADSKDRMFRTSLETIRYLSARRELPSSDTVRERYDLHMGMAMPWACLIVTMFGIPAGAATGRRSTAAGIFTALAFFFAYYALYHISSYLGQNGLIHPALAAWMPNMVFAVAGIALLARIK